MSTTTLTEINCPMCRQGYEDLIITCNNTDHTISCVTCNEFHFNCNSGRDATIKAFYDTYHLNPYGSEEGEGSWWLTKYGKKLAPFRHRAEIDNIISVQKTLIRIEHFQLAP